MTLVFAPSFEAVEDAIDWFHRRGYEAPKLWHGPDGLIRGSAALRTNFGICAKRKHALTADNVYREPKRNVVHCIACRRERQRGATMKTCGTCGQAGHNRRTCGR